MKRTSWFLLLLLFGACGKPQPQYVLEVELKTLQEDEIYHQETVYDVIFDAEEQTIDSLKLQSRQLFLQAVDQFRNKKDPYKAVNLFKESILKFPEAKTYYELGNALLETTWGSHEAIKAFEVAEYLQFEPKANIYFGQAKAYNQLVENGQSQHSHQVSSFLIRAMETGFADTMQVLRNAGLRKEYKSESFQTRLAYIRVEKARDKPNALYSLFLKSFRKVQQPFEVPVEKVDMKAYNRTISYDFQKFIPEMQNSSFGRDVSHEYFYVANVAETPAYTALLYSSVGFSDEDMQPVMTKLITLDNQGKVISNLLFSCQCSAEKVKKGRLENNTITLQDFKRVWRYPIDQVAFDKNQVVKYEPQGAAITFQITETGEIVEGTAPAKAKTEGAIASRN